MKTYVCKKKCFYNNRLWGVGDVLLPKDIAGDVPSHFIENSKEVRNLMGRHKKLFISATQLKTWMACKRKWWAERILKLPGIPSHALCFGSVFDNVANRWLLADGAGRDKEGKPAAVIEISRNIRIDQDVEAVTLEHVGAACILDIFLVEHADAQVEVVSIPTNHGSS